MTVNSKTRPPPMCLGKKNLGHLCQEMRCRYKLVMQRILLKDSPCTEPVRSWIDNQQKGRFFVIKYHCIFEQWAYEGGLVVTSLSIVAEPWKHLPPSCVYIMWIFSPVQSVISMDFCTVWDVWNTPWPFRHLNSSWSISMLSSTLGRFEKFLSYIIMQLYLKAFCTWHLYILEGH